MEELRVSSTARSTNWLWAEFMNMTSNGAFQTYAAAISASLPEIANLGVTNVTTAAAFLNGSLSTGLNATAVSVYWGTNDQGTNATWANTNTWAAPQAPGGFSFQATPLMSGMDYYYTYAASNVAGLAWAMPSQYFITGPLTVQATDAAFGAASNDTATVVVTRPITCTNGPITVYYTTSGTATNNVNYTARPASGSLVILAGQTDATITLTPLLPLNYGAPLNATVTLSPGAYPIGATSSTICTQQTVASQSYTWAKVSGNWSAASNWTPAGGPPAAAGDFGAITSGTATADADLGTTPPYYPTITVGTGGTLVASASTLNTPVTFNGGVLNGTANDTLAGNVTLASGGLTVTGTAAYTISGALRGPGNLTQNGGTLTLSGISSNWTGNTTIPVGKAVTIYNNMAFGCGGVVTNRGTINVWASQPYATGCNPPALVLDGGAFSFTPIGVGNSLGGGVFPYAMSVTSNGGALVGSSYYASGEQFTGPLSVAGPLTIDLCAGGDYTFAFSGPVSGTGTVQTVHYQSFRGIGALGLSSATNTFSGTWLVSGGLRALADQALGTGGVVRVVSSGICTYYSHFLWGGLSLEAKQNYPAGQQPLIRVEPTGTVYIATDNTVTQSVDLTLAGGELSGRWSPSGAGDPSGYSHCLTGTVTLTANSYLGGTEASGNLIVQSKITGGYSLTRRAASTDGFAYGADYFSLDGAVTLANPQNDFTGGLGVSYRTLTIGVPGAQGPGLVTVLATNATMAFTALTGPRNWTVTNDLSGIGAMLVETGTNRLTLAGGTVNPGTNSTSTTTNSTGVLTVNGRFAFAATNGAAARLAIDVAGANGVAGVDHDRLAVTVGDAALAASLANGALVVNVAIPAWQLINAPPITILTATNADFRAATFGSVVINGAAGQVLYNNGSVQLQFRAKGTVLLFQ